MGMGVMDTNLGISEFQVPTDTPKIMFSVPLAYKSGNGQMDFLKRGVAGGEIYIGLAGKKPSGSAGGIVVNYDIVLNDGVVPFYNIDGLVLGDVWVFANQAGLLISANCWICGRAG